jgi:hypothetical protein
MREDVEMNGEKTHKERKKEKKKKAECGNSSPGNSGKMTMSSQPAWATWQDPISKNKTTQNFVQMSSII